MANILDTSTATTLEGQGLQVLYHMNELEKANVDATGTAITDNIQIVPNGETGAVVITITFQTDTVIAPNGVTVTPNVFLVDTPVAAAS